MSNAEYEAERLIEDLGLEYPIDPIKVCKLISSASFNVKYEEKSFDGENICGLSIGNKNGAVIIVNSNIMTRSRKLFTALHEIGHVVLHIRTGKQNELKCIGEHLTVNSSTKEKVETEANQFASVILMPSRLIKEKINRNDLTWDLINNLSNEFQTSLEATAIRAVNLAKDCYALLVHENNEVKYSIKSKSFPCYIPKKVALPNMLQTIIYNGETYLPNKLIKCDSSDWSLNLKKSQYKCSYSSISLENGKRIMTLLFIEEIEEEADWEEPMWNNK